MTEQAMALLCRGLDQLGLPWTQKAAEQLSLYGDRLLEKNQVMNLTAITDPEEVVKRHFLDSAALLPSKALGGRKVIDVGTGAGFPGMVLKVLEPTIELTLLDSLGKRVNWLSELSAQLGAAPVECIHGRAEEQALLEGYRDCYDLAVSRAVADLRILAELCLPFVKVGGRFLAMKSDNCQEEVERAGRAIAKLGGQLRPMAQYQIPGTEITRRVVVVEKIRPTPKGYPRRFSRMKKAPL
mgnify:CR=1 FL=1